MRIPSQFQDESLYRRDRRPAQPVQSYRRIFRMGLALVLVLLVMRGAAKESLYAPFFPSSPSTGALATPGSPPGQKTSLTLRQTAASQKPEAVDVQMARQMTQRLSREDQIHWGFVLMRARRGDGGWQVPSTIDTLQQEIETAKRLTPAQKNEWRTALDALSHGGKLSHQVNSDSVNTDSGNTDSANQHENKTRVRHFDLPAQHRFTLENAILAAAQARVIDGAVWRGQDQDALNLLIERWSLSNEKQNLPPNQLARRQLAKDQLHREFQRAPLVNVLPLVQQPDVYRGQIVRLDGTIAAVKRVTPTSGRKTNEDNSLDRSDASTDHLARPPYWQLWLRPTGGAERPMVAIVKQIPSEIAALSKHNTIERGPRVVIAGHFLKRLAYASARGADLAPVVVGRLWEHQPSSSLASSNPTTSIDNVGLSRLAAGLLGTVGLGVSIAILIMWRTKRMANRTRQIRSRRQKDQLEFPLTGQTPPPINAPGS